MKDSIYTLTAYYNILDHNSSKLPPIISRKGGSSNSQGDFFEFFIKDIYCKESLQYPYKEEKENKYLEYFSWIGDSKHFPDMIIRGGEGIETKKMISDSKSIALNSSYPKDYLYIDTQNIPKDMTEDNPQWNRKHIVYAVATVPKTINGIQNEDQKCSKIWLAFGNTFVADRQVYLNVIDGIKQGSESSNPTAEFQPSKEIGRIKNVDPQKRTKLRLRGMWELASPNYLFEEFLIPDFTPKGSSQVNMVILTCDFENIVQKPDFSEFINRNQLIIHDVEIPDPNTPEKFLQAKIFQGFTI